MDNNPNRMLQATLPTTLELNKRIQWGRILAQMFLITYIISIIIPFIWLFASSLKDMGQYYDTDFVKVWFPWPLHFDNYVKALSAVPLFRYLWNSVWLATVQMLLAVFSSAIVAYGLSRFEFRGRETVFIIIIASIMLPIQVTQIPLFMFYSRIGFVNSFKPLIIPHFFGSAYHIFLIRQFMMGLPKELDESAMIDGANTFTIFSHIILPQCKPALMVAGLFTFLSSWKDIWTPLIYLSSKEFYTLPLGLLFFTGPTKVEYTVELAAIVIALIPTAIIYLIGQRYLERGINIADLK